MHWLSFSVPLALAHLPLTALAFWLWQRPITWVDILKNGALLTYTTTLTAKALGEYMRKARKDSEILSILCVICALAIILPTVFVYGVMIASQVSVTGSTSRPFSPLAAGRLAALSSALALAGMFYSLGYTIYTRVSVINAELAAEIS